MPHPAIAPSLASPIDSVAYAYADAEFYAPLSQVKDPGRLFNPSSIPDGWSVEDRHIWKCWYRPGGPGPAQGWKVHVSARLSRAQDVLDVFADACFAQCVPFKHIKAELFYLYLHHKHGSRVQAGKFCVAYPADEGAARHLLDHLDVALAGEEGPYVLTDRRYQQSRTVHYRWGAFASRTRLRPDGSQEYLVKDESGRDVVDLRPPAFILPRGISDPFASEHEAARVSGPIVINGYEITQSIRPSNAGGTYVGREQATGRRVFIKEARAHNGLNWDGSTAQERLLHEYEMLTAVHGAVPGICPEPLAHFREWEHEFLVTEFVDGITLNRWVAAHSPIVRGETETSAFAVYYAACETLVTSLEVALADLHDAGFRFGDVSPGNILIGADGVPRLVDFETASRREAAPVPLATHGYAKLELITDDDPFAQDEYGLDAIALALLLPVHSVMLRQPGNLPLLRRDLEAQSPVPAWLWRRVGRCYGTADPDERIPSPEELDDRPEESLQRYARLVGSALLAMAGPDHPDRLFPTVPDGYRTNALGLAYGSAGVLHALHVAGAAIPEDVTGRFRREATCRRAELAPGLHAGLAGVAWTLAELDHDDDATALLQAADAHPLAGVTLSLADGLAGIGMAQIAVARRTGNDQLLDAALRTGERILAMLDPRPGGNPIEQVGLLHGRAGVAFYLHYLADETGDDRYLQASRVLLHEELDNAVVFPSGALIFPDKILAGRASPYLGTGTAGVAMVVNRVVASVPDERLALASPNLVRALRTRCTTLPGLYTGLAGLTLALADYAELTGEPSDRQAALSLATGIVKHGISHPTGVRFLGDTMSQRYSADLSTGSAGVLLALNGLLYGTAQHLFTPDRSSPTDQLLLSSDMS